MLYIRAIPGCVDDRPCAAKAAGIRKNGKVVPIGAYTQADIPAPVRIRNGGAEDGVAFPQEEMPDEESGKDFFAAQSRCAVVEDGGRASCRSGRCPAGLG